MLHFHSVKELFFKNKAILWIGLGLKIWVKLQAQTDISSSDLDRVTCQSLYDPYKRPFNSYTYVKKYKYQRSWDTDWWKAHGYPAKAERKSPRHLHAQTYCITQKQSREIKLKQWGFHVEVPTGYSLLSSASKPTAPPSYQLLSVGFQASWTQTLSLLSRNEQAAALHMYICLRLFWNPVFTQSHYHYFQLQLLHM